MSVHYVSRALRQMGFEPRIIPAIYVKPFNKGQKNDYNDAEAIAEAALRPNLKTVSEKTQEQLDLRALHRVRSRLVSRRTAATNQIRAFLIDLRRSVAALVRILSVHSPLSEWLNFPKRPLVSGAAKVSREPSLPNAVPQHFASAEKLALRGRPIPAVDHCH